jgi:hypothetical protein
LGVLDKFSASGIDFTGYFAHSVHLSSWVAAWAVSRITKRQLKAAAQVLIWFR